jgi:hypothetical protein
MARLLRPATPYRVFQNEELTAYCTSTVRSARLVPQKVPQADISWILQVGDEALAGRPEENISWHFPARDESRRLFFKGYYLAIYNETTGQYATHKSSQTATTEYEKFEVPAGYSVYVRGGTVYFDT